MQEILEVPPTTVVERSPIYFCDNPRSLPVLDRKAIPKEKWERVRALHKLDTRQNAKILLLFLFWAFAGWLILATGHLALRMTGILLAGLSISALSTFVHEACHTLLSKHVRINRLLGCICGIPALVSVTAYRSIHIAHHTYVKSERDPDNIENSAGKGRPLVVVYYMVLLIGIYIYLFTVPVVGYQRGNAETRRKILEEYTLMFFLYGLAFALLPFNVVAELWLYPLLVAAQLANVRGLAEHGLTTGGNDFTSTRTVLSNRFVSFFMCNLNYHLEHHLFPGVPWYHLPSIHALLNDEFRAAGASVYTSYTEFLLDFLKASWRGIIPNVRLLPAHLREEICL
jgi:fatty acid desaturase